MLKWLLKIWKFLTTIGRKEVVSDGRGKCDVKFTTLEDGQVRVELDVDDEFLNYLRVEGGYTGTDDDILYTYMRNHFREVINSQHSDPERFV